MRLLNTLTGSKEPFVARDEPVHLYVCGITPYDTTHMGHARTYLVFDVLIRRLLAAGHDVRYVQNITDVDESIIERAADLGVDHRDLGDRYTEQFLDDMARLGVLPADIYPRASSGIPEMQAMIQELIDRGHAYAAASGNVYFSVAGSPSYGALSSLSRARMIEIAQDQDDPTFRDPAKRDVLDFALWVRSESEEPAWDGPWGPGRPGWHIECSTLADKHLDGRIDIHGGGDDLVYPHHEHEIVQWEAATGASPFARFWLHVGMVHLHGKPMSKSLGNMVFVRDVIDGEGADAIRLYLLSTHYRQPLQYDADELDRFVASSRSIASAAAVAAPPGAGDELDDGETEQRISDALDDDLNTPAAVALIEGLARSILEARAAGRPIGRAQRSLLRAASLIGLALQRPSSA